MSNFLGDTWNRWTGQGARSREREHQRGQQELFRQLSEAVLTDPDFKIPELEGLDPANKLKLQGILNAVRENAATVDSSAFEGLSEDPSLREAQLSILGRLREYAKKGTTAQDQAALSDILNQTAQADRGRRDAIDSQMRRRGLSGSGMDLAAKLSSQQAAGNLASRMGLQQAANRSSTMLNAANAAGTMAGNIRGQDWARNRDVANARDALNRFNATMTQGVNTRNADRQMRADERNLNERQRIADYNSARRDRATGVRNQNNLTRYGLLSERNQYLNNLRERRATARNRNLLHRAGVHEQQANNARNDRAGSQGTMGGILASAMQAIASFAGGGS